jgi:glycerol uptake facilitator-like aquaporin
MPSLARRGLAEGLGTAFLLAAVVGSGIMAAKLAGGNGALALLCNTLPTGAILTVLILIFGPLSGAHFNPAVSLAFAVRGELPWSATGVYIFVQIVGAVVGVWAAHLMFELPLWQLSTTIRTGPAQWFAEVCASFIRASRRPQGNRRHLDHGCGTWPVRARPRFERELCRFFLPVHWRATDELLDHPLRSAGCS